jgi:hypothetical protein
MRGRAGGEGEEEKERRKKEKGKRKRTSERIASSEECREAREEKSCSEGSS